MSAYIELIALVGTLAGLLALWGLTGIEQRFRNRRFETKRELECLARYREQIAEYDRWMASIPDVVLLLGNLRGHAEGSGDIGVHAAVHGRYCHVHELRARILVLRDLARQTEGDWRVDAIAACLDDECEPSEPGMNERLAKRIARRLDGWLAEGGLASEATAQREASRAT